MYEYKKTKQNNNKKNKIIMEESATQSFTIRVEGLGEVASLPSP